MDIRTLVSKLTLEEKASLCSGMDNWHTQTVERLNIPNIMVADGPHGLRKEIPGESPADPVQTVEAVCFPTGGTAACSFDRDLMQTMGEALGTSCQAEGVAVLLGPAANIKRSPLCGRNFEYLSEDPYLTGELAAAYIRGVEEQGVGTSLKHFAANNQETRRMTVSAEIDERTLREIYLSGFETAVKKGKPSTVMCSYNKINGTYSSENPYLLTDILRKEWGFDGLVVSDWGAVNIRPKGVAAGLDLEMPTSYGQNDAEIVKAVREGRLDERDVDLAAERVLKLVYDKLHSARQGVTFDRAQQHALARKLASESLVLLKNQDHLLPLDPARKIAFIGPFAESPRYQGGGSSHINSWNITGALEAVQEICPVTYAQGCRTDIDETDEALLAEAIRTAREAEVAVLFTGLPDAFESESYDRNHMQMPRCQLHMIEEICKVQKNVVVVLHNGAPVEMPWEPSVKGILEAYLGGQAVGGAEVDLLFGRTNPCGRLAETIPMKLSDTPSFLNFPGEGDRVEYKEGIFVGYRYYDKKEMPVRYPFGYGLSYTTFAYSNLRVDKAQMEDTETLHVTVNVKNTGTRAGKEVVQLYTGSLPGPHKKVIRAVRELKGFEKVELQPGEEKTVEFLLNKRSFAYYDTGLKDWYVESGAYEISIGKSSQELVLSVQIEIHPTTELPVHFTMESTVEDLMENHAARKLLLDLFSHFTEGKTEEEISAMLASSYVAQTPIHTLCSFDSQVTLEMLESVIRKVNSI